MKLFNKILAVIYFILLIAWLIFGLSFFKGYNTRIIDAVFILSVFIGILILGLIHWRISNSIFGILREKFLVICSSINLVFIFCGIFIASLIPILGGGGEVGELLLPVFFFVFISSLCTFIFGMASIFKTNKKSPPTVQ